MIGAQSAEYLNVENLQGDKFNRFDNYTEYDDNLLEAVDLESYVNFKKCQAEGSMYIILPDKIVNYLLYDKLETSLMSISIFMNIKISKSFL